MKNSGHIRLVLGTLSMVAIVGLGSRLNGEPLWTPVLTSKPGPEFLSQGWEKADREVFYTLTQGSQLIRADYFAALERPNSKEKFHELKGGYDSLERFGYLTNTDSPEGLPVGFVTDPDAENPEIRWLGMTCGACHTGRVEYNGRHIQIDGAPANGDLYGLLKELTAALQATDRDYMKFARFAAQIKNPGRDLRGDIRKLAAEWQVFLRNSTPSAGHEWGPARTDAFGMIFNRTTSIDLGVPMNSAPPDAPVSYQHLWGSAAHNWLQWDASLLNTEPEHVLARNVGQVLGVFARIKTPSGILQPPQPSDAGYPGYPTTANLGNLTILEEKMAKLSSPKWNEAKLPRINLTLQQKEYAAQLFKDNCAKCHDGENSSTVHQTKIEEVGTDRAMATASISRRVVTAQLEGQRQPPPGIPDELPGPVLGRTETPGALSLHITVGAVIGGGREALTGNTRSTPQGLATAPAVTEKDVKRRALKGAVESGLLQRPGNNLNEEERKTKTDLIGKLQTFTDKSNKPHISQGGDSVQLYYKGRSLEGIWATAPYLHNGSVPNLRELLKKPAARIKYFTVGSREFDPHNVGFKSGPHDRGPGGRIFKFDATKPGNLNTGHDYGTSLSPSDKDLLIEYLKSL